MNLTGGELSPMRFSSVKTVEEHKQHFTQRLLERYNIQLRKGQYEQICKDPGKNFKGIMSKHNGSTIGYIFIGKLKVWVLYNTSNKCYTTCYPPVIETDLAEALRACFSKSLKRVAFMIFWEYMEESKRLPPFTTAKQAALYLFENTLFPHMHIQKYKHGALDLIKTMNGINNIIHNRNQYTKLTVRKATQEEIDNYQEIKDEQ